MASLAVPLLYVFIVFGGLWVFSTLYKRHTSRKVVEPYFPRHRERDIYVSLLQKTDPPAPEALLKAALLRRAVTTVGRIMRLRDDKPAMQNLLQKGSIGDDLWNSLLAAEKELETEILEIAAESNTFVEGWGQLIFATATELYHSEKIKIMVESIQSSRAEKEQKYGVKTVPRPISAPVPPTAILPPTSAPTTPARQNALLAPSSSATTESALSSDNESTTSPTSPRTPSKSAKKNKRRK